MLIKLFFLYRTNVTVTFPKIIVVRYTPWGVKPALIGLSLKEKQNILYNKYFI